MFERPMGDVYGEGKGAIHACTHRHPHVQGCAHMNVTLINPDLNL